MHEILPFVWFGLPLTAYIVNRCLKTWRLHPALLYCITGFTCYVILLVNVFAVDAHLKAEAYSFDLDGDGWFSEAEMTPAAEEAMQEFTSDTGRTFAPAFGIPFTAIWVGVCFAVLYSAEWIARLTNRKPKEGVPETDLEFNTNVSSVKNENPFHPPSG